MGLALGLLTDTPPFSLFTLLEELTALPPSTAQQEAQLLLWSIDHTIHVHFYVNVTQLSWNVITPYMMLRWWHWNCQMTSQFVQLFSSGMTLTLNYLCTVACDSHLSQCWVSCYHGRFLSLWVLVMADFCRDWSLLWLTLNFSTTLQHCLTWIWITIFRGNATKGCFPPIAIVTVRPSVRHAHD